MYNTDISEAFYIRISVDELYLHSINILKYLKWNLIDWLFSFNYRRYRLHIWATPPEDG